MLKMTFGFELEVGDVRRDRKIPTQFGDWEYSETDIVNMHPPVKYRACDPLGEDPPWGGEINIRPGRTIEEVAERVCALLEWFRKQGDQPSANCISHNHVHVRAIGLRDNIQKLKRLTSWIANNQADVIRLAHQYAEHPLMAQTSTARTYLKWDGGRPMPEWMAANIVERAVNFDDFIRLQCCGKDGVSRGRPFRYALNTYCLKHNDTIETRCIRHGLSFQEIYDSLRFARDWLTAALEGGLEARHLFASQRYALPKFEYHHPSYVGWEYSKYDKTRGVKKRAFYEIQ